MAEDADVIVVGGGLAGLVAATEIADAGKRVIVVDQEGEQSLGGQAFWSFGGLFLVDSPEQRRLGIRDSYDLALQDWMGSAGFDRDEDLWPKRWAEAYVAFAAGEKRGWLRAMGHRIFPVVGWAERGGYDAMSHGNSVPRFHVSWGTGPGIVEPFERRARQAQASGRLTFKFRHRVDALSITNGIVDGVSGAILAPDHVERGKSSSRKVVGDFALRAQAVIVASGGIGGNHDLVRQNWPKRLGAAPKSMISGVPDHVDGILVLSGGESPDLFALRGTAATISSEGRLVEALDLARRFPQARIVFSGVEADVARAAFAQMGAPMDRFTFENRARNSSSR